MVKRLVAAATLAMMMAITVHAQPAVPLPATSNLAWTHLTAWAAAAICNNLGLCFGSTP
ncbi:MAG TPA: hypothetical protein VEK56_15295 [Vicinamibacterales bacterium]|nr:hypothetical protein [Vicinamibacterales bacterium]